jgi:hypothetical protein
MQDSYLRPPGHITGVAPSVKAKRTAAATVPGLCAEPSKVEFADRKRGGLRQHLPFRSGAATIAAADRDRRPRQAWPGTEESGSHGRALSPLTELAV